ncbi:MAG: Rv2175c family DNA-binding protein, partial [Actinomycetota bacterium]|nr:Rv2175c family DNA-binding protein [Actinomycetota bacterium]
GAVVKSLSSVITQLRDARYSDSEIVDWLFRADDSLPGTPIQALRENRGSEVKRRAQVAGY